MGFSWFQTNTEPSPSPRMSHRDRITLTPWQKWKKHKKFPWKIIVHVLLLTTVTVQLVLANKADAAYFRSARRNWLYFFFPSDYDFSSREQYLYTVNETVDSIKHAMDTYSHITTLSLDVLNYTYEGEELERPCVICGELTIESYNADNVEGQWAAVESGESSRRGGGMEESERQRDSRQRDSRHDEQSFGIGYQVREVGNWPLEGATERRLGENEAEHGKADVEMSRDRESDDVDGDNPNQPDHGNPNQPDHGNPQPRGESFDPHSVKQTLYISPSDLGPFDPSRSSHKRISTILHRLKHMQLGFSLISFNFSSRVRTCLVWRVNMKYDFTNRGQIVLTLDSHVLKNCDSSISMDDIWSRMLWLNLVVILFSVLHLFLNVRSLWSSARIYARARKMERAMRNGNNSPMFPCARTMNRNSNLEQRQDVDDHHRSRREMLQHEHPMDMVNSVQSEGQGSRRFKDDFGGVMSLSFSDKLKFFNLWFLSKMVASLCLIAHAMLNLSYNIAHTPTTVAHKMTAGLGCALLWANLVAYLAHNRNYYTVVLTLQRAIPRVLRFMVGAVPILLAYAFFGMLYFGDYTELFGDFQSSMITLFSVLNGDMIRDTFMDLLPFAPTVCQLYLYSFICLFIYVVLNVFIAIVEESFFSTRTDPRQMAEFADTVNNEGDARRTHEQQNASPTPADVHGLNWFHRVLDELDNESFGDLGRDHATADQQHSLADESVPLAAGP